MSFFGPRKLPELVLGIPPAPASLDVERWGELDASQLDLVRSAIAHARSTWPARIPELRIEEGYLVEGVRVVAKIETSDVDAVYRIVAAARAIRWLLLVDELIAQELLERDESSREETITAENPARPQVDA